MTTSFSYLQQTERIELFFYAIFGILLASLPLLMKLFAVHSNKLNILNSLRYTEFAYGKRYFLYFSFPLAAFVFWSLVHLNWKEHTYFISFASIVTGLAIHGFTPKRKKETNSKLILGLLLVLFSVLALAINFSTTYIFSLGDSILKPGGPWHHWGAFISAAKSLDSGLAIFKDFPTQYGFGPTLLIAGSSHLFGWVSGMFYIAGLLQFLFWLMISAISISIIRRSHGLKFIQWIFILLITTFGCFFWMPGLSYFSNIYPSLGGGRYLPATIFVAVLFLLDLTSQNISIRKIYTMHALWAFCALWSIESLFYACFIWWPYYIYIRLPDGCKLGEGYRSIGKSIVELLSVAIVLLVATLATYSFYYRSLPEYSVYTAFVTNIPGTLLINLTGTFVFAASVFLMSLGTLVSIYRSHGKSREFHFLFVNILLTYSAFSYYIGRSHDLNILPLVPFFCLILLSMCPLLFPKFIRYFSITLLSFLICWIGVDKFYAYVNRTNAFEFRGSELDEHFKQCCENPKNSDVGRAIEFIYKNYNESVVAVDPTSSVTISGNQEQWNAYNNIASYNYLPSNLQKSFIDRSKAKLMKPGWILIHKDMGIYGEAFVLDLFKNSYFTDKTEEFGEYRAYRFLPKP